MGSFIMTTCLLMHHISCRDFWQNIKLGDSAPLEPKFGTLRLKLKSPLKGKRFQTDSRKYDGAADGNWENCVRSQGAYFEGDRGIIVLCTMFLVSLSSSLNVSIFHITWLDTL